MSRSVRAVLALCGVALGLTLLPRPAGAGGATPDDPVFEQGLQWGLERIGAPQAWSRGTGAGITVAVVDSGVDLQHEDLRDKVVGHVSCIGSGGQAGRCGGSGQDDHGHGTHVAGIALADTGNGRGIAGVAPDADLLAVRVLSSSCDQSGGCSATGSADDVAAGVRWAADHGADVINLSLGGGTLQGVLGCAFCDAVEYAWAKGAIPVIAAGNDAILPAGFADEHALIVTATTRGDGRASYSNASSGLMRQARWPVAAPGGENETAASDCATGGTPKGILSTYWSSGGHDEYACLAGTSMATPHVSGALAVLLSQGRTPQAAVDRLLGTAQDLGPAGRDEQFGVGLLDLARAVSDAPAGTTSSTGAPVTTEPPVTASTTATTSPATTAPPVSLPTPVQAAPFSSTGPPPRTPERDEDVPGWLVATAIAAVAAAGTATTAGAWHLAEQERRHPPPPRS